MITNNYKKCPYCGTRLFILGWRYCDKKSCTLIHIRERKFKKLNSMIPKSLLKEILADPYYKKCIRKKEGKCKGRTTLEHTTIYEGNQIQEKWAIVPLCAFHHGVDVYQDKGDLKKELGQWIALTRATDEELERISKAIDYKARRNYLNDKYKHY